MLAGNVYVAAKRQGRWSWPQFFVVVASLIIIPVLIVAIVFHIPALDDKPVLATLIAVSTIIAAVTVLALLLKKYWPLPRKSE